MIYSIRHVLVRKILVCPLCHKNVMAIDLNFFSILLKSVNADCLFFFKVYCSTIIIQPALLIDNLIIKIIHLEIAQLYSLHTYLKNNSVQIFSI